MLTGLTGMHSAIINMMRLSKKFFAIPILLTALSGCAVSVRSEVPASPPAESSLITNAGVSAISYSQFRQMVDNKETFIVMVGRSSCKYCAVLKYILTDYESPDIPMYTLDLEGEYWSDEYDSIKEYFGVSYVPFFRYIKDGELSFHMNSPLGDSYFDKSADHDQVLSVIRDRIDCFVKGCSGTGTVVDDAPAKEEVFPKEDASSSGVMFEVK